MKTKIFISLTMLLALLLSCNNDTDNSNNNLTKYLGVVRSGCADGLPPEGGILDEKPDTLYHFIVGDTLIIHLAFNDNCCIYYADMSKFFVDSDDKIDIILMVQSSEPCYCKCYYEFNYKIVGYKNIIYHYSVLIKGRLQFTGKIDLR